MNTKHGMGIGLVGLLLSTAGFAAAPVASETSEQITVAAAASERPIMEEIVVKARHPDAEPKSEALGMYAPLDLLSDAPIHAPELGDQPLVKPEIRLNL